MTVTWPIRLLGRGRWIKVTLKLLVVSLVLSLVFFRRQEFPGAAIRRRPAGPTKRRAVPAEPTCSHVYRLSSVSYRLEAAWPAVSGCEPPLLTPPLLRRCVVERARRRRRPTSLLLLGDSRLRILYNHLADELGVPTPPEGTDEDPDWQKHIRWDNSPERWCQVCPRRCCPRSAAAAGVSLRFEWRPYWTDAVVADLEAAAERCERGGDDCPDLVLLNGALWYMTTMMKVNSWKGRTSQLLLQLRLQLARAAAALTRLSSRTRTVWKLDEGMPYDVHLILHGAGPAEVPIAHSLVYDLARKIPGLVIWTSALPESTGFLRRKCYSMQGRDDPESSDESPVVFAGGRAPRDPIFKNETFIKECGEESLHPSKVSMTKAVQMMFADLCSMDLNLANRELGKSRLRAARIPICCTEYTFTARPY